MDFKIALRLTKQEVDDLVFKHLTDQGIPVPANAKASYCQRGYDSKGEDFVCWVTSDTMINKKEDRGNYGDDEVYIPWPKAD